ncbi:helix-turn-helix domain-containing protein [Natrarchaeobius sp. A-rgal3]|uniref:helix-turn-helix domain-containing protein n=1 Tax=Natrarchaeobius versutus TaxID=1679078 RepID=UPI00350FB243
MAILVEFVVSTTEFPLGRLFSSLPGVSVELERIVPTTDSLFPYVWVRGGDRAEVDAAMASSSATDSFALVDDLGDRGMLYRVTWEPDVGGIVEALADSDSSLLSATGTRDQWTFGLRVDDHADLLAFQDCCRDRGVRISVTRLQPLEYADENERITTPQLEALELAFRRGYFDDSRRVTLDELASELDITRQSLAGRLRRGHRNVLADVFGTKHRPTEHPASFVDD